MVQDKSISNNKGTHRFKFEFRPIVNKLKLNNNMYKNTRTDEQQLLLTIL